jgi:tRNA (cmo5U34)-methyltransferase
MCAYASVVRDEQYHFDPTSYDQTVRVNVPSYETLQSLVAEAAGERPATRILDLGTGTGETLRRAATVHPDAELVGVDESEGMLAVARASLPASAELRLARLQDELPDGPFDVAVSVLAIHHLDAREKQHLFRAIHERLAPRGRFVLGDLITPDDPTDIVTPRNDVHDKPSSAREQVEWLQGAGFDTDVRWHHRDLFVVVADRD